MCRTVETETKAAREKGLRQPALFEGHHTADAEQEVAALLQLPVGVGVFGEGVENTPQAQPFFCLLYTSRCV